MKISKRLVRHHEGVPFFVKGLFSCVEVVRSHVLKVEESDV